MLWWIIQTTLTIGVLAAGVWAACRFGRFRPAVQHVLWLVVLVKFLTPSFVAWPWAASDLWSQLRWPSTLPNQLGFSPSDSFGSDRFRAKTTAELTSPNDLGGSVTNRATGMRPVTSDHSSLMYEPSDPGSCREPTSVSLNELALVHSPALPARDLDFTNIDSEFGNQSGLIGLKRDSVQSAQDASSDREPRRAWVGTIGWLSKRIDLFAEYCWHWHWFVIWSSVAMAACWQLRCLVKSHLSLRNARAAPPWFTRRVRRLADRLNVHEPRTMIVSGIASPFVWCLGRAKLLWPESLAAGWLTLDSSCDRPNADHQSSDKWADRWEGVIAHELAHMRRRDHWIAWLELVATCFWWWNPLFWFVRRRLRESAELACDAWAVWSIPDGERAFAESLLEVTRLVSRTGAPVPALGVSTGARRSFERRLTMILCERVPCKLTWGGMVAAAGLALIAVPGWMAAQEASTAPASTRPVNRVTVSVGATDSPAVAPAATDPNAQQSAAANAPSAPSGAPATIENPNAERVLRKDQQYGRSVADDPTSDRIARLEQQLESLLSELRTLRGERAREGVQITDYGIGAQRSSAISPDGKSVAVLADDGSVSYHDVETGKELRGFFHVGAGRGITFTPDGKALIVRTSDGRLLEVSPWTAKILRAIQPQSVSPDGRASTLATESKRVTDSAVSMGGMGAPVTVPGFSTAAAQASGAAQLDLIRLATEYSDAVGSVKLSQGRLELAQHERASGSGSVIDVLTAQVNLETASNKVHLLRAIAESAGDGIKAELEYTHKLVEKGFAAASQEAQIRAKLRILELILNERETPKK